MKHNLQENFTSFNPAVIQNWILQVSQSKQGICIVMFHRFSHKVQINYVKTRDEATQFVTCVLNK
jgi:hypothetical protein